MYGIPRAHKAAKAVGIRILPGALLTLKDGPGVALLARDPGGWSQLTRLITEARTDMKKGWGQLHLDSLLARSGGLEAILLGDWSTERASAVRDAFGAHVSLALTRRLDSHDPARWDRAALLSARSQIPLVATCDVHMHAPSRLPLQDVLTCIRRKCSIDQAGTTLSPNASRHLRSPERMARMFSAAPHALERCLTIMERCQFSLDDLRYRYPREIVPEGWTPMRWLTHQTQEGLRWRYPEGVPSDVPVSYTHLTLPTKA